MGDGVVYTVLASEDIFVCRFLKKAGETNLSFIGVPYPVVEFDSTVVLAYFLENAKLFGNVEVPYLHEGSSD